MIELCVEQEDCSVFASDDVGLTVDSNEELWPPLTPFLFFLVCLGTRRNRTQPTTSYGDSLTGDATKAETRHSEIQARSLLWE
jgi:hypothetical protein